MPELPRLPGWLTPAVTRTVHLAARWTRPMTLGVRAAIFDDAGRVCLVRHSYVRGWHLPGGGVEPGETVVEALTREIREEAGLVLEGTPAFHGVFFNRAVSRRDHVLVYEARRFRRLEEAPTGLEIVERGFFAQAQLPDGTTGATRRRLAEIDLGQPPAPDW